MIHECKVQCHSMNIKDMDALGIEDNGKWLPFIFDMDMVEAAKLSSDELDSPTYNCTTIFTRGGDTYIIDTDPQEFFKKFTQWNNFSILDREDDISDENDLEL